MPLVYKHFKLDTKELFYIGIGGSMKRVSSHRSRNQLWHNIVAKHSFYAEIHIDNINYQQAKEIEIELIKKYGRIDLCTGVLCNMTDGGDGNTNVSKSTRDKISNSLMGIKQSDETKLKRANALKITWQDEKLRELKRVQSIELNKLGVIGIKKGSVSKFKGKPCTGDKSKISNSLKKYFSDTNKRNDVAIRNGQIPFSVFKCIIKRGNRFRKETVVEIGEFVMDHINVNEVARMLNIKTSKNIRKVLHGERQYCAGYTFKYKNINNEAV